MCVANSWDSRQHESTQRSKCGGHTQIEMVFLSSCLWFLCHVVEIQNRGSFLLFLVILLFMIGLANTVTRFKSKIVDAGSGIKVLLIYQRYLVHFLKINRKIVTSDYGWGFCIVLVFFLFLVKHKSASLPRYLKSISNILLLPLACSFEQVKSMCLLNTIIRINWQCFRLISEALD